MIVVCNPTFFGACPLNTALTTLLHMTETLLACERGEQAPQQLTRQWRQQVSALPLPARYGEVAAQLLDRLDAGALFSEESCSFSQKELLASLRLWADKAREQLNS